MSASMKEYKEKKQRRPRRIRTGPILGVALAIVVVVAVVAFYSQRQPVKSNVVYCGVFEYLETTAESVIGDKTSNVTLTMTTAVSYTTTTFVSGPVGHTYSNVTSTTNTAGLGAGVETICRFISSNSTST